MPTYSEGTLISRLHQLLGPTAEELGWTETHPIYGSIVEDALRAYGVDTIEQATDTRRLLAIAELEAWRAALRHAANLVDQDLDGQKLSLSQLRKGIADNLAVARGELASVDALATAAESDSLLIGHVEREADPYRARAAGAIW